MFYTQRCDHAHTFTIAVAAAVAVAIAIAVALAIAVAVTQRESNHQRSQMFLGLCLANIVRMNLDPIMNARLIIAVIRSATHRLTLETAMPRITVLWKGPNLRFDSLIILLKTLGSCEKN
ncbi:hypothetical protein GQX74_003249 [Glossina fuscipes]|nr:hypothetical protein GQX74_003249 [Glossina fuscipes]